MSTMTTTKRKDLKGRVLKTGESQRKDGTYQYRFTDHCGKRQTIYANTLVELRDKEEYFSKLNKSCVDFSMQKITVAELIGIYIDGKAGRIRESTKQEYERKQKILSRQSFGQKPINTVNYIEAKRWLIELKQSGSSYNTVCFYKGILTSAFQMAVEYDYLVKNPFGFKLSSIIDNDTKARKPLTPDQYARLIDYIKNDRVCNKHFDAIALLGETGMRVSELCGLTINDIDFKTNRISISKQLVLLHDGSLRIEKPKSINGIRYIPMTDLARKCAKHAIQNRSLIKKEFTVDGVSGFLFLTLAGNPETRASIRQHLDVIVKRYNSEHSESQELQLPHITPHILRHTFCTRLVREDVSPKTVQYLMGHSDIDLTLDVYTHIRIEDVEHEFCSKVSAIEQGR